MNPSKSLVEKALESRALGYGSSFPIFLLIIAYIMYGSVTCNVRDFERRKIRVVEAPVAELPPVTQFAQDEIEEQPEQLAELPTFEDIADEPVPAPVAEEVTAAPMTMKPIMREISAEITELEQSETDEPKPVNATSVVVNQVDTDDSNIKRTDDRSLNTATTSDGQDDSVPGDQPNDNQGGGGIDVNGTSSIQTVAFSGNGGGTGLSMGGRVSAYETVFRRWIMKNLCDLPPNLQRSLNYDNAKDVTAKDTAQDSEGNLYNMFFLYREDENLMKILVVIDNKSILIDFPGFVLDSKYVQVGTAGWLPDSESKTRRLYDVSLQPTGQVTNEVTTAMNFVLAWLELNDE